VPFPIICETGDTLRNMTVTAYMEDLHRGSHSEEEEDYEDEHVTVVGTVVDPVYDGNGTQNNAHGASTPR